MNTNEQVKKEMAKIIMKKCLYKRCFEQIGDALFEKGNVNKITKDMKLVIPDSFGNLRTYINGKFVERSVYRQELVKKMKNILNKRDPKQKDKFISLFNKWWTNISYKQAKDFIEKQSKEVLRILFFDLYIRETENYTGRIRTVNATSRRLKLINNIGNTLKNVKEEEEMMESILKLKGTNQGRKLLNMFLNSVTCESNQNCPLTLNKPNNPVTLKQNIVKNKDGKKTARRVYNEESLKRWLKNKDTHPFSRQKITLNNIVHIRSNRNIEKVKQLLQTTKKKTNELRNLFKKAKEREGEKFKYESLKISNMLNNIK